MPSSPEPERTPARAERGLRITVVRSGGFAGLRREWHVHPPTTEAESWVVLIDACPWDAVRDDPASRDRFVWSIEARITRTRRRTATVPERELVGPWRELVDRVRDAEDDSDG